MIRQKVLLILLSLALCIMSGCSSEGESSSGITTSNNNSNGDKHGVTILRPSPCQRIYQPLYITVSAESANDIDIIYITINNKIEAVFNNEPFTTTIYQSGFPPDGTYNLKAVAEYKDGTISVDEIKIRIDVTAPYIYNLLVLDADADPLGLGGKPGALFRIDPVAKIVCTLASSNKFVHPTSMAIEADGSILVTDLATDLDGDGPGVGAVFRILPDRFNHVSILKASGLFRAPTAIDIDQDTGDIYVADYDANPFGLPVIQTKGPGAIFRLDPFSGNITKTISKPQFVSPIGVTVDSSGDLWITDADANPNDDPLMQYHGSVWRYHMDVDDLELISASNSFLTPFQILPYVGGDLLLVDSGHASGTDITPGRLFAIDPTGVDPQNAATLVKEGLPFANPAGTIFDEINNYYLIADRNAGLGEGSYAGGILLFDQSINALSYLYASARFVEPLDVAISRD